MLISPVLIIYLLAYIFFFWIQLNHYKMSEQSDYNNYIWKFEHVEDLAIFVANGGVTTDALFYGLALWMTQYFTAHQIYVLFVGLTHFIFNVLFFHRMQTDWVKLLFFLLVINSPFCADYLYGNIRSSLAHAIFLLAIHVVPKKIPKFFLIILSLGFHMSTVILFFLNILTRSMIQLKSYPMVKRVLLIFGVVLLLVLLIFNPLSREIPSRNYGLLYTLYIIFYFILLMANKPLKDSRIFNFGLTSGVMLSSLGNYGLDRLLGLSFILTSLDVRKSYLTFFFFFIVLGSYLLRYVW